MKDLDLRLLEGLGDGWLGVQGREGALDRGVFVCVLDTDGQSTRVFRGLSPFMMLFLILGECVSCRQSLQMGIDPVKNDVPECMIL